MTNKENALKRDRYAINVDDKYEIEYWSTKLGLTTDELLKAVHEVGDSSLDVKEYIKNAP